ncbi:GL16649 [Drosophila persimilis]|uniref:GL16649 n=1 Tax=Drosophila persimilis TaxID=7234 RepID=B4HAW8_DROPE|nr:GL16649 [Drosophila persimilis]
MSLYPKKTGILAQERKSSQEQRLIKKVQLQQRLDEEAMKKHKQQMQQLFEKGGATKNAALEKINKDYEESRAESSQLEERIQQISQQLKSERQADRSSSSNLHIKMTIFSEQTISSQKELTSKAYTWVQEML